MRWHRVFVGAVIPVSMFVHAEQVDTLGRLSSITAEQMVVAVLANNPTVRAGQAASLAAQLQVESAAALDDPMLSYNVAPRTVGRSANRFGQNLQFSQTLPWPGKREWRRKAAESDATATQNQAAMTRRSLILQTRVAFADWSFAYAALRINAENQALWKEFSQIVEQQYGLGRSSKQDLLQAELESGMLEHEGVVLERQRKEAQIRLNQLLYRAPDAVLPPPSEPTIDATLAPLAALRAKSLRQRPELREKQAELDASMARVQVAKREFYPDVQLMTGYDRMQDDPQMQWTVGIGINIPLDQSKRRAAQSAAQAQVQDAGWQLEAERSAMKTELDQAYAQIQESIHVITLYRDRLLPLSEETLRAAKTEYQSGTGSFLMLINAEKQAIMARLRFAEARADYGRRVAQLAYAVGDDIEESLP